MRTSFGPDKNEALFDPLAAAPVLDDIVSIIQNAKANHNGKTAPYGFVADLIEKKKVTFPWLTKDRIYNYMKKLKKETIDALASTASPAHETTPPNPIVNHAGVADAAIVGAHTPVEDTGNDETTTAIATIKLPGRPKGTSIAAKLEMSKQVAKTRKEAAEQYYAAQETARKENRRVKKGTLSKIIESCKEKNGLPEEMLVNPKTILKRVRNKNFSLTTHPGTVSPMAEIEPYIVDLMTQLQAMRTPLSPKEGLELVNSIISGTSTFKEINEWRQKHCSYFRQSPTMKLSSGYWRGFRKRHKHLVMAKRPVKFDYNRDDWCTYQNFSFMYEKMYEEMHKAGIARLLDTPVWFKRNGEITESEEEAFGLKTRYILSRPDKLLHVDEVGCNTSQAKDGHVGGQKLMCTKNGRATVRSCTKDAHFTVLCFTAATGEPVMCVIIFAATKLESGWVTGLDPSPDWNGDNSDGLANSGAGMCLPGGPVCNFNGNDVPTLCCASESGSITSELLAKMLEKMDELQLFDRSDGVDPFLILDGHHSRFQLPFLDYIINPDHHWNVCIGVPYGTSYWQVGDSSQQNGSFKMLLSRHKKDLLTKKADLCLPFVIEKTDIVYLVSKAFEESFGRKDTNWEAGLERGWYLLNYILLLHPEIQATKPRTTGLEPDCEEEPITVVSPGDLNLTEGFAGSLVDRVVLYRNRNDARTGVDMDRQARQRAENARQKIENGKNYTAGLHFQAGNVAINSDVHAIQQEKKRKAEEKQMQQDQAKRDAYNKSYSDMLEVMRSNKTPEEWTTVQLKAMVKWHKQPGDAKMPTTKQGLLARYYETRDRANPTFLVQPVPAVAVQLIPTHPPEEDLLME